MKKIYMILMLCILLILNITLCSCLHTDDKSMKNGTDKYQYNTVNPQFDKKSDKLIEQNKTRKIEMPDGDEQDDDNSVKSEERKAQQSNDKSQNDNCLNILPSAPDKIKSDRRILPYTKNVFNKPKSQTNS